jgi:hypothetical protein
MQKSIKKDMLLIIIGSQNLKKKSKMDHTIKSFGTSGVVINCHIV